MIIFILNSENDESSLHVYCLHSARKLGFEKSVA